MDSAGVVLGWIVSRIVSTTGEGTVVDILLGMVGAVIGGWVFTLLGRRRGDWFQHRHRS
jgi:uncharacterized membrane protein YeaQ/YmgE (transglycosylase-associated protein family)